MTMTTKRRDLDTLTTLLVDASTLFPLPSRLDVRAGERLIVELDSGDTIVAHVETGIGGMCLRLAQPATLGARARVRRPRVPVRAAA